MRSSRWAASRKPSPSSVRFATGSQKIGHPISQFHLARCEGLLAQAAGRFDEARVWCEQTCRLFARLEDSLGAAAMPAGFDNIIGLHAGFDADDVDRWDALDLSLAPPFLGDLRS